MSPLDRLPSPVSPLPRSLWNAQSSSSSASSVTGTTNVGRQLLRRCLWPSETVSCSGRLLGNAGGSRDEEAVDVMQPARSHFRDALSSVDIASILVQTATDSQLTLCVTFWSSLEFITVIVYVENTSHCSVTKMPLLEFAECRRSVKKIGGEKAWKPLVTVNALCSLRCFDTDSFINQTPWRLVELHVDSVECHTVSVYVRRITVYIQSCIVHPRFSPRPLMSNLQFQLVHAWYITPRKKCV